MDVVIFYFPTYTVCASKTPQAALSLFFAVHISLGGKNFECSKIWFIAPSGGWECLQSMHSKTHTILSLSLKERWVWISQEIKNACWAHRGQGGCEGVFTLPTPRQKKILEKGNRSSYGRAIFETFLPFSMEEVHTHVCWWDWCVYTLQLGVLAHIHKVSVW